MRQRLLEARRREAGFTLIELLIVIVILGVLAAIVVFAVGAFNDRGQTAACQADVKAVEVAVEAYRAQEGTYPDDLTELVDADYLREAPNTDPGAGEYHIEYADGTVVGYLKGSEEPCAGAPSTGGPTTPGGGGGGGETPTPTPTTSTTTTPPAVAPSTPTNVNAQSNCPGSGPNRTCTASWNASAGNPTPAYEWEVDNNGGSSNCNSNDFSGQRVASGTATGTSVQIQNLNNNQNYCFRVRAVNSAGQSGWEYDPFQP